MLKLNVLQKLFFSNLVGYSSKFNIYYFLTPAATSKALIAEKPTEKNRKLNLFLQLYEIFIEAKNGEHHQNLQRLGSIYM